jgi:hypothetical protein
VARIVVIGNAAGGKSTLARQLVRCRELPLNRGGPVAMATGLAADAASRLCTPACRDYRAAGLGDRRPRPPGLDLRNGWRSTEIVLIDMPLWMHFALAAERQIAWARGQLDHPPAGAAEMPPTAELFRTMWEVEQTWMPELRSMCAEAELEGKAVTRLKSVEEIDAFVSAL